MVPDPNKCALNAAHKKRFVRFVIKNKIIGMNDNPHFFTNVFFGKNSCYVKVPVQNFNDITKQLHVNQARSLHW